MREGFAGKNGRLFFEYARILNICKALHDEESQALHERQKTENLVKKEFVEDSGNTTTATDLPSSSNATADSPFFWLFENTVMDFEDRNQISFTLACEPLPIDAINLSPMKRKRLFWSNIPLLSDVLRPAKDDALRLQDVLEEGRRARVVKIRCLTTKSNSQLQGHKDSRQHAVITPEGKLEPMTMKEYERCFGFPDDYTKGKGVTVDIQRHLLGMSWSIPCVKFLFTPLTDYFMVAEKTS